MSVIKLIQSKWPRRLLVVDMSARPVARFVGAVVVAIWAALLSAPLPFASAQPCPDVDVVFARGTAEPPGVGGVGEAFVDALRSQVGGRSVEVYPVNYEASSDFGAGIDFARTFVEGIRDAGTHVQSTAANCPHTRIVLGGYSQGAALAGFVTSAAIPSQVPPEFVSYLPKPMPPEVANHVAAVTLFGRPSNQFLTENGAPPITIGPLYAPKTIDLCAPDDGICNGAPGGGPSFAHASYLANGMTGQAAGFAASHL
jgi:cutinase